MKRRSVLVGLAVLLLLQGAAVALYIVVKRNREPAPAPFAVEALTPREAPLLAFERVDRTRATLASLRGKVVMIHFWATWCEPCRDELPSLLALADELGDDFVLLAVSVDDDWEAMRRFFSAGTIHRAAVRPEGVDVHRRFGASTLPDTYLVDASGLLVQRIAGARDWRTRAAREHLKHAVAVLSR